MISNIARLLLVAVGMVILPSAHAQGITGKWIGIWRVLDNDESDRMVLDLKQTGTQLTGTVTTIGHAWQIHGVVADRRFEIFLSPRDTTPRITGSIKDNELHITREGAQFVAISAKAGDAYPNDQASGTASAS